MSTRANYIITRPAKASWKLGDYVEVWLEVGGVGMRDAVMAQVTQLSLDRDGQKWADLSVSLRVVA